MIASFDLTAWGRQLARILRMLWGGVIDVIFVVVLALAVGTAVKLLLWHVRRRRAARAALRERYRPDGSPYPPADEGICDRCGRAFDKVYYMPAGGRLCPDCYEAAERDRAASAGAGGKEAGPSDGPA